MKTINIQIWNIMRNIHIPSRPLSRFRVYDVGRIFFSLIEGVERTSKGTFILNFANMLWSSSVMRNFVIFQRFKVVFIHLRYFIVLFIS